MYETLIGWVSLQNTVETKAFILFFLDAHSRQNSYTVCIRARFCNENNQNKRSKESTIQFLCNEMCSIVRNAVAIYTILCVLSAGFVCAANRFLCKSYDASTKSLEMYGERFKGIVPFERCTENELRPIESDQAKHLKISGCDCDIVVNAVDKLRYLRTLDISYSYGYAPLDWLHLTLEWLKLFNASNIELQIIPRHFFQHTTRLRELDLSHNRLRRIDAMAFSGAQKLTKLNLSYNRIWIVRFGAMDHLNDLESVDLSRNCIKSLEFFRKNQHLKVIHVEANPIADFYCMHSNNNNNQIKNNAASASVFMSWKNIRMIYGCMNLFVVHNSRYEAILPITMDQRQQQHFIHCNQSSFENLEQFIAGRHAFENVVEMLQCIGVHAINIDLSGNSLDHWDPFVLHRFPHLQMVDLSDTMLSYFDLNVIKNVSRLQKLDISSNNLDWIGSVGLLPEFVNLRVFNVAGNRFGNGPELLGLLPTSIEVLDVSDSFIGELHGDTFIRLTALKILGLRNTMLSIPLVAANPFDRLKRLLHLDISHNNLKSINLHVLLTPLTQLSTLNVAFCEIQSLSLATSQSPIGHSIQMLNISGNDIGTLDGHAFDSFTNVVNLDLSHTKLSIATGHNRTNPFGKLRNLRILDISHNNFEKMNFSLISNLKQLSELNVAHCHINNITDIVQHMGSSLVRLDLSGNCILPSTMQTFQSLSNLMYLDLSNANLTTFNLSILKYQSHLVELHLSNNNLHEIEMPLKLQYLSILDLHENNLHAIDRVLQKQTATLQSLDISRNRLQCASVKELMQKWTHTRFINEPWNQKSDKTCEYT